MTAMPVAQTMTAEEFLALEIEPSRVWNLVDGELVVNEPDPPHQRIVVGLVVALGKWIEADAGRGELFVPLDVLIDERNVYKPDLLWYAEGHPPTTRPFEPPDLAIEVGSPSTWRYDTGAKKSGYERGGLPELWLVDTAASEVLVFRRSAPDAPTFDVALQLGTGGVLESPQLPGFALPLERVLGD